MTDFIQNINLSWDSTDTNPVLAGDLDVNNNNITIHSVNSKQCWPLQKTLP